MPQRRVRIASVSYLMPPVDHPRGVDLRPLADVVREVARAESPAFICFPENCASAGEISDAVRRAPEIEPFAAEVGQLAREIGAALIIPTLERDGQKIYSSVPIVDAHGKLVAVYRKNYPTAVEIESGISPGRGVPVVECDGVRVGAAVCFDLNFSDVAACLERGQARLVFWPSMFLGGQFLQHWALRYGFYLAASSPTGSAIVDMNGRFLVKAGYDTPHVPPSLLPRWTAADVNPSRELFHLDHNEKKLAAILQTHGSDVHVELCRPEGVFLLSSAASALSIRSLMEEFELEPLRDYLARSRALRQRALET